MSHKTFDNNVVAIYKNNLALKLHKLAHVGMCILEMSEVLMYEFHYDYIKNKHDNKSKIFHRHCQFTVTINQKFIYRHRQFNV